MARTDEVESTLLRLNSAAWGIALGLLVGLVIFIPTIILVIRGGKVIGPHLGLLGVFLPGYSVTVGGAFIGLVYGFAIGWLLGRLIGGVYNLMVRKG